MGKKQTEEEILNKIFLVKDRGNRGEICIGGIMFGKKVKLELIEKPIYDYRAIINLKDALKKVYEVKHKKGYISIPRSLVSARVKIVKVK